MTHLLYPETFPTREVASVVAHLRGQSSDPKATLFDAWVVEGYALMTATGQPDQNRTHGRASPLPGEPVYQRQPPVVGAAPPGGGPILSAADREAKEAQDAAAAKARAAHVPQESPATNEEKAAALAVLSRGMGLPSQAPPPPPSTNEEKAKALENLSAAMSGARAVPSWLLPLAVQVINELVAVVAPPPVVTPPGVTPPSNPPFQSGVTPPPYQPFQSPTQTDAARAEAARAEAARAEAARVEAARVKDATYHP